jgi:hypothetical protein
LFFSLFKSLALNGICVTLLSAAAFLAYQFNILELTLSLLSKNLEYSNNGVGMEMYSTG